MSSEGTSREGSSEDSSEDGSVIGSDGMSISAEIKYTQSMHAGVDEQGMQAARPFEYAGWQ